MFEPDVKPDASPDVPGWQNSPAGSTPTVT